MDDRSGNSSSSIAGISRATSTQPTVTISNTTVKTSPLAAASTAHDDGPGTAVTVVVLTGIMIVAVVVLVLTARFLKRRGKLNNLPCWKPMTRSRKSSISSSRRALADQDEMEVPVRSTKSGDPTDDMFTIEDLDDPADLQGGREEYFYDEVFAQSHFEDETTNNAMRQLYSERDLQPEEEQEGLSVDFETLGIRLDNYSLDPSGKDLV